MPSREKLLEFTAWCEKHITGDEKGQAQIFLGRLFQAFGQAGCLDVGGSTEGLEAILSRIDPRDLDKSADSYSNLLNLQEEGNRGVVEYTHFSRAKRSHR
jgi:hypothetical protein